MSGICGYMGVRDEALLGAMTAALEPRGRDVSGKMFRGGVFGLGWRGAVSGGGAADIQPAYNENESVCVVCDGRPLNAGDVRERLAGDGHSFVSGSAAEVIAHAYEQHGIGCVELFNGRFAFAIWDQDEFRLIVARDRLGFKPLYYYISQDVFLFASSTDTLRCYRADSFDTDFQALDGFLAFGHVPGERSMFKGIRRLEPGHMLICGRGAVRMERYWRAKRTETGADGEHEWLDEVSAALKNAADAGAFNRGGAVQIEPSVSICSKGYYDFARLPVIAKALDEPAADMTLHVLDNVISSAAHDALAITSAAGLNEIMGTGNDNLLAIKALRLMDHERGAMSKMMSAAALVSPRLVFGDAVVADCFGAGVSKRRLAAAVRNSADAPELLGRLYSLFTPEQRQSLYTPKVAESVSCGATTLGGIIPRDSRRGLMPWKHVRDFGLARLLPDRALPPLERIISLHAAQAEFTFLDHRIAELAARAPASITEDCLLSLNRIILWFYVINMNAPGTGHDYFSRNHQPRVRDALAPLFAGYLSEERVRARGWLLADSVGAVVRDALKGGSMAALRQAFALTLLEMWCDAHL